VNIGLARFVAATTAIAGLILFIAGLAELNRIHPDDWLGPKVVRLWMFAVACVVVFSFAFARSPRPTKTATGFPVLPRHTRVDEG
jgi:hypothetical protein